jgi:4-carboxymuconolactone decarboxylase
MADTSLPADVYPDSRSRLPLITREELDDDGKALFDGYRNNPQSLAGLVGPGGIRMHSPKLVGKTRAVNRFLRFEAGLDKRLMELAILTSAREMDAHFEWHAHEAEALRVGLEPEIIDVVRHRKPTAGLGERETALIELGREAIGKHRVSPQTFARALRLFGKEQLIYYVTVMGEYAATSILLATFDQNLPEGKTSTLP